MTLYKVTVHFGGSSTVEVEAETRDQAEIQGVKLVSFAEATIDNVEVEEHDQEAEDKSPFN